MVGEKKKEHVADCALIRVAKCDCLPNNLHVGATLSFHEDRA